MRSTFGECSGNVRSTPTPNDCLRTVNVSRAPWPWRLMTTPSKTWVRRRVPSMTWEWTLARSPGWKAGTRRSCARSRLSMTVLMAKRRRGRILPPRGPLRIAKSASARPALAAAHPPPRADLLVVAGQQHVGHLPAPVLGRPGVVRVLRLTLQRGAEGLLQRAVGMPERARQLAQDGVHDD